jgi:hypothetical protein
MLYGFDERQRDKPDPDDPQDRLGDIAEAAS